MANAIDTKNALQKIVQVIGHQLSDSSIDNISRSLRDKYERRTLQRLLKELILTGQIISNCPYADKAKQSNNLLPHPAAYGRLRTRSVGISRSVFTPLGTPQLIEEMFDLIIEKVNQIIDPFEQAFFIMVHSPYLRAFDDVNKRVSRLAADIPLSKKNLAPLSFVEVPEKIYIAGLWCVYGPMNCLRNNMPCSVSRWASPILFDSNMVISSRPRLLKS
jgi:hypothetical protein